MAAVAAPTAAAPMAEETVADTSTPAEAKKEKKKKKKEVRVHLWASWDEEEGGY